MRRIMPVIISKADVTSIKPAKIKSDDSITIPILIISPLLNPDLDIAKCRFEIC